MAALYLIPTTLGESDLSAVLPEKNNIITRKIRHFIVEDVRTARRFLRKVDREFPIDDCSFSVLNQHTQPEEISRFLEPLVQGNDMGIISEAGCPAVADPGADIVAMAQRKNLTVVPLVGPSSILLAVMGSGFNGQSFAFVGYLPIESVERAKALKRLESRATAEKQTQLFIETPYRNAKMLDEIIRSCNPRTRLCIAVDLTLDTEFIRTKTVAEWKNRLPDLSKRPCVFALYC
ncbi:MAG: SAM-dependent methyltransferase [Prevotellaceae bacterium]|jgi:16S rRNA (cytidine1402-2'-O)-methyltransferase|nr:SAM-dependent methyltransferase [Prevotellaceae bacterium]